MSEEKKYHVRILSEEEKLLYDVDGAPVLTQEIMYATRLLTPGILRIPSAEYTEEERAKRIRVDIERRMNVKPSTFEV